MPNCFIHSDRPAAKQLRVPCAPGGVLYVCAECARPENGQAVFDAYSSKNPKRPARFAAKVARDHARSDVGLVLGGDIHTSIPDDVPDWDFPMHPAKSVGRPLWIRPIRQTCKDEQS